MADLPDTSRAEMERLAAEYARAHDKLSDRAKQLQGGIDALKTEAMPQLRTLADETGNARAALAQWIVENREMFAPPRRTLQVHGLKVGLRKRPGKVVVHDEAQTIAKIRALLPTAQAELLVRIRESVDKTALADIEMADLRRLGVGFEDAHDFVVLESADKAILKFIDGLLADAERNADDAAA